MPQTGQDNESWDINFFWWHKDFMHPFSSLDDHLGPQGTHHLPQRPKRRRSWKLHIRELYVLILALKSEARNPELQRRPPSDKLNMHAASLPRGAEMPTRRFSSDVFLQRHSYILAPAHKLHWRAQEQKMSLSQFRSIPDAQHDSCWWNMIQENCLCVWIWPCV